MKTNLEMLDKYNELDYIQLIINTLTASRDRYIARMDEYGPNVQSTINTINNDIKILKLTRISSQSFNEICKLHMEYYGKDNDEFMDKVTEIMTAYASRLTEEDLRLIDPFKIHSSTPTEEDKD